MHLAELQKLADAVGADDAQMVAERYGLTDLEAVASQMVSQTAHEAYLASLAKMAKNAPDPRGVIDYYKGRDTKAARRYKEWTAEEFVKGQTEEVLQEAVDAGAYEIFVGDDGKEYIKKGPNYEQYRREHELGNEEEGSE